MSHISINREDAFKNETISSIPIQSNNIIIQNNPEHFNLKKEQINNIRPMLSSSSHSIPMSDSRKIKIKPKLNRSTLSDSFNLMANPKKNMVNSTSSNDDNDDNDDDSSNGSSNDILSNQSTLNKLNNG
jgi:hypothetical protein